IDIQKRVIQARKIQQHRCSSMPLHKNIITNAEMTSQEIKKHTSLDANARDFLSLAFHKLHFSPRSYFKILKVAQTIADLQNESHISQAMIAEAVQYRSFLYR
ncbi:MAG TPA: hypothetical protein PLT55_03260, partial [Acidimicrobiia bacterium]|nr:hypothetical protein [Acidimicrobiia bacterium]